MPRPHRTLPIPPGAPRLRLVVDPSAIDPLYGIARDCQLSVASLCRVIVEMVAAGQTVSHKSLKAEAHRRRAEAMGG